MGLDHRNLHDLLCCRPEPQDLQWVDRLSTAEATAMEIAEVNRLMEADLVAIASTITNQDRRTSVAVDVTDESCHRSILFLPPNFIRH